MKNCIIYRGLKEFEKYSTTCVVINSAVPNQPSCSYQGYTSSSFLRGKQLCGEFTYLLTYLLATRRAFCVIQNNKTIFLVFKTAANYKKLHISIEPSNFSGLYVHGFRQQGDNLDFFFSQSYPFFGLWM